MLIRDCAGGVVFSGDKIFLLKNEKGEWVLPKGIIRSGDLPNEVAIKKVKEETGVEADIVTQAGGTSYEFYSVTRQRPICNRITWYIMKSEEEKYNIQKDKFSEGGFFDIKTAMDMITYSQDRSLLSLSYAKYKELT